MRWPHIHWHRLWNTYPLIFRCRCGDMYPKEEYVREYLENLTKSKDGGK